MEASGLDPKKHSMVSVGAIEFERPERQFYAEPRVWEGAQFDPDALQINGFSKDECLDESRRPFKDVMRDLYTWIEKAEERTLVAQNPSSDRDFVNAGLSRTGISWRFSYRTIDLHTVAIVDHIQRGITIPHENQRSALNLDAILKYVGLPEEPRPHNALTGAMSHAEALSRILYAKALLPEFSSYPIPPHLQTRLRE